MRPTTCFLVLALTVAAAIAALSPRPTHAAGMPIDDPLLNPKTYTSPSGAYALTVTPDNPNGSGGASYTMTVNGTVAWKGTRDFTLWNADVTDTGIVGGVAYSQGEGATMTLDGPGTISAVILAPDGTVRAMHTSPRHHNRYMMCPTIVEPTVEQVIVDADMDRLILWMLPEHNEREHWLWWCYRLSDGASLGEIVPDQPRSPAQYSNTFLVDAIRVGNAPLVATHWVVEEYDRAGNTDNTRFALLDARGKEVWRLDIDDEYARPRASTDSWSHWYDLINPGIRQLVLTSGGFEVRSYKLEQRVGYAATCNPQGDWIVSETSRAADTLPLNKHEALEEATRNRPAVKPIDPIALPAAGILTLQLDKLPLVDGIHDSAIEGVDQVIVGRDNLIYATGSRDSVIHVFDMSGRRLRKIRSPHTSDTRSGLGSPLSRWSIGSDQAALVNPDGTPIRRIRKRPDGAWLASVRESAVAPDGSLALIVTAERGLAALGADCFLCIYDADASPIATIPLPPGSQWAASLAFNGSIACVCIEQRALLVWRDGAAMRWFQIPGATEGDRCFASLSADGSELWINKSEGHTIHRFALPRTPPSPADHRDAP